MKRKLLSLLLVLALALSIIPAQALAASYPSMIPRVTENSYTIPQGETGYFEFTIFHEYWNECYNVAVYDSYGSKVASVYKYLYDTPLMTDVTITAATRSSRPCPKRTPLITALSLFIPAPIPTA